MDYKPPTPPPNWPICSAGTNKDQTRLQSKVLSLERLQILAKV